jgi:peptide/nickel transport system permease protein
MAGGLADRLQHLVLPGTVLAAVHAAAWSRYLRASMVGVLGQRFIVAARARGVPWRRVVVHHALRNALLPFVTVILLDAAIVVSGAVVTESVFAWPGLGGLFTEALARRDYTVLMAFLMLSSVAVIVLNLLADLSYRLLDPRVGE